MAEYVTDEMRKVVEEYIDDLWASEEPGGMHEADPTPDKWRRIISGEIRAFAVHALPLIAKRAAEEMREKAAEELMRRKLPCDVRLPGVLIRKGCDMKALMAALDRREDWGEKEREFKDADIAARAALASKGE